MSVFAIKILAHSLFKEFTGGFECLHVIIIQVKKYKLLSISLINKGDFQ